MNELSPCPGAVVRRMPILSPRAGAEDSEQQQEGEMTKPKGNAAAPNER